MTVESPKAIRQVIVFSRDEHFRDRQQQVLRKMNEEALAKFGRGVNFTIVDKPGEIGRMEGNNVSILLHDPTIEEVRSLRSLQGPDFAGSIMVLVDKSKITPERFEKAGATQIILTLEEIAL